MKLKAMFVASLATAGLLLPQAAISAPRERPRADAKTSVSRDRAKPAQPRPAQSRPQQSRDVSAGNAYKAGKKAGTRDKRETSANAYKAGKQSGSRGKRDVVVVGNPGRGYYDNGHYHHHDDWDDDDNDFLEFVGKTAAVTAGVAVVSAVIGEIVKDEPEACKPVVSGGRQYLLCDGVYYQQVPSGYQVVAPPAS